MPVAYGIFLAVAQIFLNKPNNVSPLLFCGRIRASTNPPRQFGLGTAVPVQSLASAYDGKLALVWADGTNGTGTNPSAEEIIARITRGFSSRQLAGVRRLESPGAIPAACPQNFNLFSECFAAVAFNSLPGPDGALPLNYTLRADAGLFHVDVVKHSSDYEQRLLPLQWAIDSVRPFVFVFPLVLAVYVCVARRLS